MRNPSTRHLLALTTTLILGACSSEPPAAPEAAAASADADSDVLPFAAAKGLAATLRPCKTPEYRQFDFWLGQWEITEAGAPAGTNVVEPLLGGCAIRENYLDPAGGSVGTSLNSYDADTKQWRQTWVADYGTDYRMAGNLDASGTMVLVGERINAANGRLLIDTWKWTPVNGSTMVQTGRITVPATGRDEQFWNGEYHRVGVVNPPPMVSSGLCDDSPYTDADFLAGSWNVKGLLGISLGRSTITKSVSGCLVEEHFTGRLGYEAIAFTYRDPVTAKWYRSAVDNLGERIELEGEFAGNSLVLTGDEAAAGGTVRYRLTLTKVGARVEAKHEISRNGGSSWVKLPTLNYIPG
jgi:hypothetical protein